MVSDRDSATNNGHMLSQCNIQYNDPYMTSKQVGQCQGVNTRDWQTASYFLTSSGRMQGGFKQKASRDIWPQCSFKCEVVCTCVSR